MNNQFELRKAGLARAILNEENEDIINQLWSMYENMTNDQFPTLCAEPTAVYQRTPKEEEIPFQRIPGLPYTLEERRESIRRAEAEDLSESMTMEEFEKEMETW